MEKMSLTASQAHSQAMNSRVLASLAKLGLVSFGLGAGARGLKGLVSLGNRNLEPTVLRTGLQGQPIDIPFPRKPDEEEEKRAEGEGLFSSITKPVRDAFSGNVSNVVSHPAFIPAAVIGTPLAAYGGYKLTDMLMNKRRKSEQESELEKIKREYEAVLAGQHKISTDLDQLYDHVKKATNFGAADTIGLLSGIGLGGLGLLGLGSGVLTYDMTKKRRAAQVLQAAKSRRDRLRMLRTPPPIFAQTTPVRSPKKEDDEDEKLQKAASDHPNPPAANPVHQIASETPETPNVLGGGPVYNPIPIGSSSNHPAPRNPATSAPVPPRPPVNAPPAPTMPRTPR